MLERVRRECERFRRSKALNFYGSRPFSSGLVEAAKAGRGLGRQAGWGKALPALVFVVDPARTPDGGVAIAARLPRGTGVIYRSFGAPNAPEIAAALARIARQRGLILLIGADEALAARCGAHGLHLPERMTAAAPRIRARRPGWLITTAAHDPLALARAARAGCDAALFSTVFESRSASAGRPIGPVRFAALSRGARLPVYALGGVNARTAMRLLSSGAAGLAAVEGVVEA